MGMRAAERCFRLAGGDCAGDGEAAVVHASILALAHGDQALARDGSNNAQTTINPALGSYLDLTVTTALACVYSATSVTPFIASGELDGQVLLLRNRHTSSIQFNAGVAGSKVRLIGNSNKTVGAEDSIMFVYDAGDDVWNQVTDIAVIT